jgi:DNA-binding NarL/FixJ family response regulator
LFQVIKKVAGGEPYFSPGAWEKVNTGRSARLLTSRQLEALAVSAAYPDLSTHELARKLTVSASTFRNLLSGAYKRLGVSTRVAAIARAGQLGLLTNASGLPDLDV